VSSGTWGQGFSYDGFGNLTGKSVLKGSAPYLSVGVDAATNRIVGYNYDANGNQLTTNTQGLGYDVENRVSGTSNTGTNTGSSYGYDPDNRRIYTSDSTYDYGTGVTTVSNEMVYFYGVSGQLMGSYQLVGGPGQVPYSNASLKMMWAGDRVYFGGRFVGSTSGGLAMYIAPPDRLGSKGQHFPYGEDRGAGGGMFGTYTRDAGGLDYAVNRYYNSGLARFMTPDPYRATTDSVNNPADPGSWNRYGYGGGDPTNLYDPNGLESISPLTPITFACPVGAGEGLQWVRCDLFGWTPPRPLPADPTHCDPGWFDLQSTHTAANGKTYSGADLDFAARVIFAEVSGTQMALAGGYSDQLDAERDAIASVLYNRIGNTGFGSPQSFTAVGLQQNQFQAVTGNQKQTQKFNRSNFASSKNLNQADCDDLNSAIEAVRKLMKDSPTVDFTFFWAASTGHSGTVIGGSVFWGSTNP
jgi:RHS repeat-associated protein